ncbi:hypothetical protein K2173_015465 [Erythroxylum novogranatense]|uniref:peptidylprolyl isomerase n=1 Tax=Erythroxylum novogranatense TaxID=1862640 RepID=A0AAV8SSM7_9ROSI|nr:hypothetical protein K2173_015465 [Erythroxylum novogranatense]
MEAPPLLHFPSLFQFSSGKRTKDAPTMVLHDQFTSLTVKRLPRRMLLKYVGFNTILFHLEPVFAAPMPEMKQDELNSGVRIQEIVEGKGSEVHEGDVVLVNYGCRRSNGYFVHSTVDQFSGESSPVKLVLDEKQIIKGLKEVLIGMKVGGKRRALIPASVAYTSENLEPMPDAFGPRRSLLSHVDEPLIFEVQLLKVLLT